MTITKKGFEKKRILVTGANGFVGKHLTKKLIENYEVIASSRKKLKILGLKDQFIINTLDENVDWSQALSGCSTIIHLAARAHITNEKTNNSIEKYRKTNVCASINLAKQATKAGVKKFIFISTIGVNGSKTSGLPFLYNDEAKPHSPYAVSKHEAEKGLQEIANKSQMKIIVIRPPLIYDVHAPGNIATLVKVVKLGLPLPFLNNKNKRSIISLNNLNELILKSIEYDGNSNNNIFLASNDKPLSTKDLIKKISRDLDIKIRLFYLPQRLLYLSLYLVGKRKMGESLFKDLVIDNNHTKNVLDWSPHND
jgi:nucleoside-diphosphate-sugar epimerase